MNMHLSKNIPVISRDAAAMLALGERIAARREVELNTLPAPEGYQPAEQPGGVTVLITVVLSALIIAAINIIAAVALTFLP